MVAVTGAATGFVQRYDLFTLIVLALLTLAVAFPAAIWVMVGLRRLVAPKRPDALRESELPYHQPAHLPMWDVALAEERPWPDGEIWLSLNVKNPLETEICEVYGQLAFYVRRQGRARADDDMPQRGHYFVWTTTDRKQPGVQNIDFGPKETKTLDIAMGKGHNSTKFCHAGVRAQAGYVGIRELGRGTYTAVLDIVSAKHYDKVQSVRVEVPMKFDGKGKLRFDGHDNLRVKAVP